MTTTIAPKPALAAVPVADRPMVAEMVEWVRSHGWTASYVNACYMVERSITGNGRIDVFRNGQLLTSVED